MWFSGFYDVVVCWILKNASHTATSSSCIFAFVSVFNAMAFWAWIKQFGLGLFLRLKLSLLLGTLDIVGSNSSQSHSSRGFQADKVIPVMTLHICIIYIYNIYRYIYIWVDLVDPYHHYLPCFCFSSQVLSLSSSEPGGLWWTTTDSKASARGTRTTFILGSWL